MWRSAWWSGSAWTTSAASRKNCRTCLSTCCSAASTKQARAAWKSACKRWAARWNAYTSSADTTFVIEAPARNQRKVLDLLLAVIRDTPIDAKALATAKRIIEREDGGH